MEQSRPVRIDKWLWAVRLYKSRSLASEACSGGKIKLAGQPVKASRAVKEGDIITAVTGDITRTVKVRQLLENRVGAKLVPEYLEDLMPASEYEKKREPDLTPFAFRAKGKGRPTKKERRSIEEFRDFEGG